ncbi:amidoligase family protein [Angustibacter aerolatus]
MTLRRTGFELELLAPPGTDRAVLAAALASRCGGGVRPVFHADSEPSLVPGMGSFLHLTPGFAVHDAEGLPVATLVDDITIAVPPTGPRREGWYRLLSDDQRLLRLVALHADPGAAPGAVLEPVAELFGTTVERFGPFGRVGDETGSTVALAAPLPPGRERPCEIVTPPIERDHLAVLESLLAPARALGFTVPVEAAVHLHVDGGPFRQVHAFTNLVRLFAWWRPQLRQLLGTNPGCVRLAPLPETAVALVEQRWDSWEQLQAAAREVGLVKFADVNLTQLVAERPLRDTVEVRVLPGSIEGADVVARAELVEGLLRRCESERPVPPPSAGVAVEHLLDGDE